MGILALVLGILGLLLFSWLGPTVGAALVAMNTLDAPPGTQVSTAPLWIVGILVGVILPLGAASAGVLAIISNRRRGIGIAGLVCGVLGAALGLTLTLWYIPG